MNAIQIRQDQRGGMTLTIALLVPVLIALLGLVIDTGLWAISSTRLQIAADAGAMAAAMVMSTPAFQAQTTAAQRTNLASVAQSEASGAANKLLNIMSVSTPIDYDTANYSYISITVRSQSTGYFTSVLNISAPLQSATTKVSFPGNSNAPCALALSTKGTAITVDNAGSIIDSHCGIFSDSPANPSIYLNSGTITGTSIGAVGTVVTSNSGSNTMSPPPSSNKPAIPDPYAAMTAPTPGACAYNNATFQSGGVTYNFTPTVFCGNTVIGGNGSHDTFAPGIYYVVNGNLTFSNAAIASASGVTFVITGSTPGNFSWVNNNGVTLTAPTSGPTAGILIWQVCNNSGSQTITFDNGSALQVGGTIYAPCAAFTAQNNIQLAAVTGATFKVVASTLTVAGSAGVHTVAVNNPVMVQ